MTGWGKQGEKQRKNRTNRAWVAQQLHDPYVQLARKHGYRSRAAFKLVEIDRRDRLIRRGMVVVDLGSAPGAWSQLLRERLARSGGAGGIEGRILALDLLPMEPIHGVEFIQGDFHDDAVLQALTDALDGRQVDLVLSDMAPNMSGIGMVDQARVMVLAELTLEFCALHLKPGGAMLAKVFQGDGFMELRRALQDRFQTVQMRKPAASRNRSAEIYLLARNKKV